MRRGDRHATGRRFPKPFGVFESLILFVLIIPPSVAQVGAITPETLAKLRAGLVIDAGTKAVMNAVAANSVRSLAVDREQAASVNHYFTHRIKTEGITDQKSSGRCWLFAGLNIMRPIAAASLKTKSFEFSQNYLFFYDKLEKANLFLESIIATRSRPIEDRDVEWLLKNPFPDGGQWNMVLALVEKYGAVPADIMPETESSGNTAAMNSMISTYLHKCAAHLRAPETARLSDEQLRREKERMLADVYRMLTIHLGVPPERFTWRCERSDGTVAEPREYTPKQFFDAHVGLNLREYVCLYSIPSRPFDSLYEIRFDRNVFDQPNMTFANIPIGVMKDLTLKSVLANDPVWFGCDVGKESDSKIGVMKRGLYDYASIYGVDLEMDKATRVLYQESIPSHAMVIIGVDMVGGKPEKWLVENSWGAKAGKNGLFAMYDSWFDEYVFAVIIHRKYLPKQVADIFTQKPIELPPWDPMFTMWLH